MTLETLAAEKLYYVHSDHLSSTSLVTDEGGNVVSQQSYFPYGETRASTSSSPTERQYTGQISDTDQTGLYYYNARYYNPTIAKFTQADTEEGPNRYLYVGNNPMKLVDPGGNVPVCANEGDSSCWGDVYASTTNQSIVVNYVEEKTASTIPVANIPKQKAVDPNSYKYDLDQLLDSKIKGWEDMLVPFRHETDPEGAPPLLSTMVEGNRYPKVTGLYNIKGALIPKDMRSNPNDPDSSQSDTYLNDARFGPFAPAVSLGVGNSALRVPYSDYIIGQGQQAMVIYTDENSIAFNYGTGGDTAGYTVYMSNITLAEGVTNNSILTFDPLTGTRQIIGWARDGVIYLAVTDNGDWWDPRWVFDFWDYEAIPKPGE